MKSPKFVSTVAVLLLFTAAAGQAASIDMDDPRRAVGREDGVRVDAQMFGNSVSPGRNVGVTYQITNDSPHPIAVADKTCDVSYDIDTQTITVRLGSEIPEDGLMPRVEVIAPGEKKVFTAGGPLRVMTPARRNRFTIVPRYIEFKVSVLRDLAPFADLIRQQSETSQPRELSDQQFEQWFESNLMIFLNRLPINYEPRRSSVADAEHGLRR